MIPVIRGGVYVEAIQNIEGAIVTIPGGLMSATIYTVKQCITVI